MCLAEDFRVNHRAYRPDLDTIEDMAVEGFEGAVDIADSDPEGEPHQNIPTPSKQQPVRRILSPGPITSNDVVGIRLFEQRGHLL